MKHATSKEMSLKAERMSALANILEDLEDRLTWYCNTDDSGEPIPPTEEDEYNYMRYNLQLEVIKAVSKLA